MWKQNITKGIEDIGFIQYRVDNCVFYRREFIFIVYLENGIFASLSNASIDQASIQIGIKFDIEDQGNLNNYIGFNTESIPNRNINLLQSHLINQIVQDVKLTQSTPWISTPDKSIVILQQDMSAPPFNHWLHYRTIVGKINFLEKCMQGEMYYATHQVAQLCKYLRSMYGAAINKLSGYFHKTHNNRLILDPNCSKSFKVYAGAEFCGKQYRLTAIDDPLTEKSRSEYLIIYVG